MRGEEDAMTKRLNLLNLGSHCQSQKGLYCRYVVSWVEQGIGGLWRFHVSERGRIWWMR